MSYILLFQTRCTVCFQYISCHQKMRIEYRFTGYNLLSSTTTTVSEFVSPVVDVVCFILTHIFIGVEHNNRQRWFQSREQNYYRKLFFFFKLNIFISLVRPWVALVCVCVKLLQVYYYYSNACMTNCFYDYRARFYDDTECQDLWFHRRWIWINTRENVLVTAFQIFYIVTRNNIIRGQFITI